MAKSENNRLIAVFFCFLLINHYALEAKAQQTQSTSTQTLSDEPNTDEVENTSESETQPQLNAEQALENDSEQDIQTQDNEITFNVDMLVERMKETDAIGVITKLSLKNQVDDLLDQANDIKENDGDVSEDKTELREDFEGLILKTVTLLNKGEDFILAEDIYQAREQLWKSIMENKA